MSFQMPDTQAPFDHDKTARILQSLLVSALKALPNDGRLRVRLGGHSMRPFIRDNQLAEIGRVSSRPKRGSVLLCMRDDHNFAIHRVIGYRQRAGDWQVRTKGDALSNDDGWWDHQQVLGQVFRLKRGNEWMELTHGWRYWLGWVYSWISPFSPVIFPVAVKCVATFRLVGRLLRRSSVHQIVKDPDVGLGDRTTSATSWLAILMGGVAMTPSELSGVLAALSYDDWDAIVRLAKAERLAPLIASHLIRQRVIEHLPDGIREWLRAEYRRNQANYAQQAYALSCVAEELDRHGIPFRLLKGLAAAHLIYADPMSRSVGDLDIWIMPSDLNVAHQVLQQLGLRPVSYGYLPGFIRAFGSQVEFTPRNDRDLPVHVDLHWHLSTTWWVRPDLTIPEGDIFARPQQLLIAGKLYPTLSETDTMFHLCLHARAGDHRQGLRCLTDIYFLASTSKVDWQALTTLCATSGMQVTLWRTFELVDEIFGSSHSVHIRQTPPRWHRYLVRKVLKAPVPGASRPNANPDALSLVVPSLVLLPDVWSIARAILRLIWPSSRWLRLRYGIRSHKALILGRLHHLWRLRLLVHRHQGEN
jgi:hypothetical protein